jgi:hypothetical protein
LIFKTGIKTMTNAIDRCDVPAVGLHDLYMPMRYLIAEGRGLALLNGLSESEIRGVESQIWAHFAGAPEKRLAVALRFRALLDVFSRRRLRQEFLNQGFKLIARAVAEGSTQRLNTQFGFSAQKFVSALAPRATANGQAAQSQFALAA